jgi:hypothetical protein
MEGADHDALVHATERMAQAEIKLQAASDTASSQAGGKPSAGSDEAVVDAEFEEVAGHKRSA